MEIIERIYQLLDEKNKRAYELCEKLSIRTSTMSTWKARTSTRPSQTIYKQPQNHGNSTHHFIVVRVLFFFVRFCFIRHLSQHRPGAGYSRRKED